MQDRAQPVAGATGIVINRLLVILVSVTMFDGLSAVVDLHGLSPSSKWQWPYVLLKALSAVAVMAAVLPRHTTSPAPKSPARLEQRTKARRLDPLLTLRAFACLLVLVGHYFMVIFPAGSLDRTISVHPLYSLLVSCPWAGVWIFFVLSGYLMGKGFFTRRYDFNTKDICRFYKNRMLRIYPVFALAVIVIAATKTPGLLSWGQGPVLVRNLLLDAADQRVFRPIGALWSVSTEFQFYLVAPFLAMACENMVRKTSHTPWLVASILAIGCGARVVVIYFFDVHFFNVLYGPFVCNLDLFLSGMLAARFVASSSQWPEGVSERRLGIGLAAIPLFYVVMSVAAAQTICRGAPHWPYYLASWLFLSGLFAVAVIVFFERSDLRRALGKSPVAAWVIARTQIFGILTYCIYVWHEPIYIFLRSTLPSTINLAQSFSYFPMVFVSVLLGAWVTYRLVESPFEKRKV